MATVNIRKTEVADLLTILELIQELADYEKMSDGPKLTIKNLIDDGAFYTSSTPLFYSFVAELDLDSDGVEITAVDAVNDQNKLTASSSSSENEKDVGRPLTRKIVGYSIGFFTFSTTIGKIYFLEDLYVVPAYRRSGIGHQLFKENTIFALASDCKQLNLHVLEWNEPAKCFYQKLKSEDLTKGENGLEYFRITSNARDKYLQK